MAASDRARCSSQATYNRSRQAKYSSKNLEAITLPAAEAIAQWQAHAADEVLPHSSRCLTERGPCHIRRRLARRSRRPLSSAVPEGSRRARKARVPLSLRSQPTRSLQYFAGSFAAAKMSIPFAGRIRNRAPRDIRQNAPTSSLKVSVILNTSDAAHARTESIGRLPMTPFSGT